MSIALYSSKHDISYTPYNNKNIPWNINTTYISQNNQTDLNEPTTNKNIYQYFKNINNSLVIESSQNNIILLTSQNTNVIVKNNMAINTDLDVSNVTTKLVKAHDISLNRKLYLNSSLPINIIGNLRINGSISISESSSNTLTESKSEFTNLSIIVNPTLSGGSVCELFDVSINTTKIILSKLYSVSIKNSYIYDSPIGYDRYNNLAPSWAIFSDVVLDSLTLDSSLNIQSPSLIKFNNNNNNTNSTIIRSSNNNSRLEITKPLIIGQTNQSNNIIDSSNISIFNGDISCGTLYYSQLYPDVRLNNYFDISIGVVSISGNSIPNKNTFNIGSTNFKFTNTYSRNFIGNLSGEALSANDLQRNLDMSFNILDIEGAFNFNGNNLEQSLIGNFLSLSGGDVSFSNVNSNIQDLSSNSGVKIGILKNYIDTCFNNPIFSYIRDISTKIVEVSSNLNVLKNYIDTCFNNPLYRRINDISTIIIEVSSNIVPVKTYFDSCFNNLLYRRITDVSSSLNTLKTNNQTSFNNIYTKTATQSYFTSNYVTLSYYNLTNLTTLTNFTNIYNITEMNTLFNPKSNFNTRIQYANSNYYHYNILNTFPVSNELNIINIASNKNGNIIVAGYPAYPKFIIWELSGGVNNTGSSYVNRFERTASDFVSNVANSAKVGICVAISYSGYVVAVAAYKRIRVYYRRSEAIGWVELDTPPPALDGFEGTSFEPYVQYSMLKQPDYGTAETFDFAHNINNLAVSDIGDTETIIMGVGWRLDRVNMYFYSGGTRTYDYSTATITRSGGSWTTQVIYASDINQPTDRDFGSNMTFAEANIYYGHNICFSVGRTILTYKCIFDFNPTRLRCVQDVPPFSLTIGNDGDIITSLKILVGNTQYGQAEATVIAVGVAKHNFVGVYTRSGYNQSWVLCYSLYGTTYGYSSPISRFGACVHVCHRFGGGHLLAISVPNKIINTTDTAIRGTVEIFYLSTFDSSILPKRFTTIIPSNYNYGSSFPDYNRYFGAGSITITETKLVAAPRMVYTITYTYLHQLGYLNMPLYFSNQNYTTNLTVQFFYSIDPVRFDFNSYGYYTSNFPTTSASQDIAKFQKTGQTAIIFKGDGTISYRSTRSSFSDVRLKDNIIDTPPKLQDVLKVRVVNFKFKGADNGKHIGVIAQELEAIFPDLVSDVYPSQQDIKLGKTEIYKAVKYSSFDVILIKAFQEQLAIINNLTFQLDEIDDKCRVLQKIRQESAVLDQELYILKRENNIFKKYINEVLKLMNKEIIY